MTPAERIAAALYRDRYPEMTDYQIRERYGPPSSRLARLAVATLEAEGYVIVHCPQGERFVIDRTGDTDRLIRQRETALRGVWADIEDGPDE